MEREWLKEARRKKGIMQSDMAKALRVSVPYYSMIESGKRMPNTLDLSTAVTICKVLGMTLEEVAEHDHRRDH